MVIQYTIPDFKRGKNICPNKTLNGIDKVMSLEAKINKTFMSEKLRLKAINIKTFEKHVVNIIYKH